jgi:PAS domain S-box-containing protein
MEWQNRHNVMLGLLAFHVPIIVGYGMFTGHGLLHSLLEASIVATVALAAALPRLWPARIGHEGWHRSARATLTGLGLVSSSAILVHLSGGLIEMHFHFFVVVATMALYQDWRPFLMAIAFVAFHHGVVGALDPHAVYNHPGALANPWAWAGVHAFFILCASAAAIAAWRFSEEARLKTEEANHTLQETASQLGATLDATADGILVVDLDGRITSHNKHFAAMWGIPDDVLRSGVDERALASVIGQIQDPDAFLARVRDLYAHPAAESEDEVEFLDGRVFERTSKPQRMGDRIVGRVWSFRDVTMRRRAEQDRVVASQRLMEIERLEEVNQFKTDLLNTAGHELNTPLTPLRLQLRALRDAKLGPLTEPQRRSVQILDRNLERLSGLVQNVLDVARLQSAHLRLTPAAVDIRLLVADCADAFGHSAQAAGLELRTDVPAGDLRVEADPDRLTQVLFNLVSNALKFTPPGGKVNVVVESDPETVRFLVRDTGRGLARDEAGKLFQPFSQVGEPRDIKAGTGLGLYICKGIIEAHGGTIGVHSEGNGRGSTFYFTLPRRVAVTAV